MDKGAQKSVEQTVRKLKTEQQQVIGAASLGEAQAEEENTKRKPARKEKYQEPTNIFQTNLIKYN